MTFLKKSLKIIALGTSVTIGAICASSTSQAADYTLTISSWTPPAAAMNSMMWPQLIKMMEKATNGRVTAVVKYRLASPPAQMDLVQDGAADMSWIYHGYNPGRFVATKIAELPGYNTSSEKLSVAYWRAHEKYFAKLNEHRGVKLIGLMVHGPGAIHSFKPLTSLSDVKGLKLRIGGGVAAEAGAALGVKGIKIPAPKVYESLASKTADGTMMPIESRKSFDLISVAPNAYEIPGGFYRGSFGIIMNSEKFASLPKDLQTALSTVFGEATSRMAGKIWDVIDENGREATLKKPGNKITMASKADQASYKNIAEKITRKVLAESTKKGVDAKAAYGYIQQQIAQ